MLRRFLHARISASERALGCSLDYARRMLDSSPRSFLALARFRSVSAFRRKLPQDARAVVRLACVLREDCGECAQIEINTARAAGVSPDVLRAVLDRSPDRLPDPLRDVDLFGEALASHRDESEYRVRLAASYTPEQMVELCFAAATAPVYPRLRRAMGFAVSCSAVSVGA